MSDIVFLRALGLMVLAATGTFEQLLTYVVFTGWLFYALGAASILYGSVLAIGSRSALVIHRVAATAI